jgi:hypothetical protein
VLTRGRQIYLYTQNPALSQRPRSLRPTGKAFLAYRGSSMSLPVAHIWRWCSTWSINFAWRSVPNRQYRRSAWLLLWVRGGKKGGEGIDWLPRLRPKRWNCPRIEAGGPSLVHPEAIGASCAVAVAATMPTTPPCRVCRYRYRRRLPAEL